eukprot:NODE_58_length_28395_cov_1.465720.p26 type:complete len:134 gc:universal NODE_58_length_28395_cov_1.465720:14768-14367(-)
MYNKEKMGSVLSSDIINRKNSILVPLSISQVLKSSNINEYQKSLFHMESLSNQLQFTLNNPTGRLLLMQFLEQEKSAENLKFYEEVVAFRRLFLPLKPLRLADIKNKANFILYLYVVDSAEMQVYLPSAVKDL